ncbi:LysR family transcriptional regulator [Kordiimonas aestuarii]|uniref:LysR family transcriptional regulator n=1 Tax=Kordiimonas aestuarii TaxID=1005925 RepID=UPI0021D2A24A|nr:LysR family transcriptional regulator [Kordiimonas aestuarii]
MNNRLLKLAQATPHLAAMHEARSFTKAADILNVHQTAVSHRIRAVEDLIGVQLFERTTRTLRFTTAGEILCSAAHTNMTELEAAMTRVQAKKRSTTIRVSVTPSLAMKWMVPLLTVAKAAGLDISVQAQTRLVDFTRDDADVGMRFGLGPYPGLRAIRISRSYMQPLASPAYIEANGIDVNNPWAKPVDILMDHTTEADAIPFGWAEFQASEPAFTQKIEPVSLFDRTDLALQAAIGGLGVALGRTLLYENDVKMGYLVPLGDPKPAEPSDWVVCSYEFAETSKFKAFTRWITEQVERTKCPETRS